MKGSLFTLFLSLFLALGLAFGQADQDAGGAVQDQPAQETPAGGDDGAADQPMDQPADQPADQPMDQPADEPVDQPADQPADQPMDQPAGEEGVAGGGQADMAADQSILEALRSNPDFSTFADALEQAGLDMTLEQEGPFTVLAPTNQAFEQAQIDLASLDQEALTTLVRNHIVSGMVSADQLTTLSGVVTLLGNELAVTPSTGQPVAGAQQPEGEVAGGGAAEEGEQDEAAAPEQAEEQPGDVDPAQAEQAPMGQPGAGGAVGLSIGEATVTQEAIQTASGVIYGIDTVLVPSGLQGVEGGGAAQPGAEEEPAEPAVPGQDSAAPGEEPAAPAEEPVTPGEDPAEPVTPQTPDGDDAGMGEDAGADDVGVGDDAADDDAAGDDAAGDDAAGDDAGMGDDAN
ncbi:MAG TPA: fasciclin domain-containing protein [Trueperaceae bacterium]